jgi:ammonia monooxygenase/methane monooxygenase subunit C
MILPNVGLNALGHTFWWMEEVFVAPLHYGFVFFGWMVLGLCGLLCQIFDDICWTFGPTLKQPDDSQYDYYHLPYDARHFQVTLPIPRHSRFADFLAALVSPGRTLSGRDVRLFFALPLMVLCGLALLAGLFLFPGSRIGFLLSLSGGVLGYEAYLLWRTCRKIEG